MKRRNKLLLYSPAFHPLTSLRRNGDFPKYQYPDYQKINPLDTIKQGAWVSAAFTPEFSQVCAITPRKAYFMPICFTRCSNSSLSQMALFLILAR